MAQISLATVMAAVLLTSGCLRHDTTHTLYLSPDGAVRWTAVELDVYSDEEDPSGRLEEERIYIGAALVGAHPMAIGLNALGPDSFIDTRVLRDERPFHVLTETRFTSIDRLARNILKAFGLPGTASLRFEDGAMVLRVSIDTSREIKQTTTPAARLAEDAGRSRIVLTNGRFDAATGFEIANGNSARLAEAWVEAAHSAFEQRTKIELMLSWR